MTSYRISTDQGWSREYSLEKLEQKLERGVIDSDALCSADGGETTRLLSQVIAETRVSSDTKSGDQTPRLLNRLAGKSGLKQISSRRDVQSVDSESGEESILPPLPTDIPMPATPQSSQIDVRDLPIRLASTVLPDLSQLYAQAEQALTEEDLEPTEEQGEIYSIPSPDTHSSDGVENSGGNEYSYDAPPELFPQSPIAEAAAQVLAREAEPEPVEPPPAPPKSPSVASDETEFSPDNEPEDGYGFILSRRNISAVVIIAGLAASVFLVVWVAGGVAEEIVFRRFEGREASLMVLQNQSKLMKRQLSVMTRKLAAIDVSTDTDRLITEPGPGRPLLPPLAFEPRNLTREQKESEESLTERLGPYLRDRILTGEKPDADTARAYAVHIHQLIGFADGYGPDRVDALHRVSELVKLSYLNHRGLIESANPESRAEGSAAVLAASQKGLHLIYPELAAGDSSLQQIMESASSPERAQLLLIRYWYYRAARSATAARWLDTVRALVDDADQATIDGSLSEVNRLTDELDD